MRTKLIVGVLILALVATSIGVIAARNNFGMQPPAFNKSGGSEWMNQLTEEQRDDVWQQMQDFMGQICDQYNLTCPSDPLSNLTKEERAEVRQKMREFRQEQRNETQEFRQKQKDDAEAFRQQICDQYNITLPSGPQFLDEGGNATRDGKWPQRRGFWREPGWF
jgi:uncharacterized membrane protein